MGIIPEIGNTPKSNRLVLPRILVLDDMLLVSSWYSLLTLLQFKVSYPEKQRSLRNEWK